MTLPIFVERIQFFLRYLLLSQAKKMDQVEVKKDLTVRSNVFGIP